LLEKLSRSKRDPREVLDPPIEGIEIRNPAFDATPPEYIDAIITEIGVISLEMAILVITEFLGHRIVSEAPKGYEDSETELRSPY